MTFLQHYLLSLYLTTVVTSVVGLWVFIKNRRSQVTRIFCLYSLAVAFWSWSQAQAGSTQNPQISLSWTRGMFYAVVTFPVLLTHFISTFLGINRNKMCGLGWLLAIALFPIIPSNLFLQPGGPIGFLPSFPRAGPLFLPFNALWVSWIVYDLWLLRQKRVSGPQPTREQKGLVLQAYAFGYLAGCTNYLYLYGICIPPLQPFASYGVPLAYLAIGYGVFAYGLFDIRIVIRKSLVYSTLLTLLTIGYFGLVYGTERFFQLRLGYQSIWVSLSAFAVMAVLFQPLKVLIQRGVDWIIFRTPQEQIAKRMERLEEEARQTEKLRTVATMAAGMAHEIKNPLTALQTFGDFVLEKHRDPEFAKKLHEVLTAETRRIRGIVQDVLDFARPKTPQLKAVDLGALLTSTIDLLSNELLKRGVEWVVNCQHNGAAIQADPDQLRQVLINLIQNAADAMPEGGTLTLTTRADNGRLELIVSDTGEGILKELLPKIFDPFVTTKTDGNGLGLAMVSSIIRAHHGTIQATSEPERGTVFTVSIPL